MEKARERERVTMEKVTEKGESNREGESNRKGESN